MFYYDFLFFFCCFMVSVLHINNIAGVAGLISKQQKKNGMNSSVLVFSKNKFDYGYDFLVDSKKLRKVLGFWNIAKKYDVFHFHYKSIFKKGSDVMFWKTLGKKVFVHHHGSDIRGRGEYPVFEKYCANIFVSTPDILEWSKDSVWIPNPIDVEHFNVDSSLKKESDEICIVHAPNNRTVKGTKYVIDAVEKLREKGYKISFELVENKSHDEVIYAFKKADIVVDQLLLGWYGMVSVEAMALGKPVCVFIDEKYDSYLSSDALVNTSKEKLVDNLIRLVEDEKLRKDFGRKGRSYVESVHDVKKITEKVNSFY